MYQICVLGNKFYETEKETTIEYKRRPRIRNL